ncbi:GNAT family N-acetyltransferase [Glycomyces rhizosphaerae]|uniref:GNAT family N-acetyltransferase n=1 Tax=Glycomyces rhizosphaerae TaxID=2054422 RepID=A0ABV7Q3I3_9ACTN
MVAAENHPVEVRPAHVDEFEAVAGLRWHWELENYPPPAIARDTFTAHFADWAREHTDSHRCMVAVRDRELIGMAWLAVFERVPTPESPLRLTGDLQSVYLIPEARAGGIGSRLVTAVIEQARALDIQKITVQSGTRAIPVYARNGFEASPKLLVADLT